MDKLGELFTETVAEFRGIAAEKVRGFEAACFSANDALAAKLVDAVMSPEDAFAALLGEIA